MAVKPISVNPLKTSPALGAAYAVQGIKGAIPLFHAAPGCTFLGKVLLTQHLREPVGLIGTDMKEIPTIMGGLEELEKKVIEACEKFKPSLIGIIGTALSEVRGEDIQQIIEGLKSSIVNRQSSIIYIPCPDYMGGFGEGYARAVERLVEVLAKSGPTIIGQVAVLPSASLTLSDIEEIKDIILAFGLRTVVLPDLSLSMDGSKERFSNIPSDGTTVDEAASIGRSSALISIGGSMKGPGMVLNRNFGIPFYEIPLPIGLDFIDEFIGLLISISGNEPPERIKRWRRRLIDGMVDTHLLMADKRIAIGLDGDLLSGISEFCLEMGMEVIPPHPPLIKGGNGGIRDLEDLEDIAEDADLIIANSHGKEVGDRLGVPLLRMGFPVFDRFGEPLKVRVGYRGTLKLLFEMANIFMEGGE